LEIAGPLEMAGPFGAGAGGAGARGGAADCAPMPPNRPPIPSSALPISLGTIQTLFASPWAICGSICMYW
jgi:hypothetical protein